MYKQKHVGTYVQKILADKSWMLQINQFLINRNSLCCVCARVCVGVYITVSILYVCIHKCGVSAYTALFKWSVNLLMMAELGGQCLHVVSLIVDKCVAF